ncbi:sensor domain-containing diguanylate cyclase [Metabacillus malikii]|uniref:Diguanylate cyclase (GGDEF)-like protein n=1 Tax=Metabacillus malikii TaxID=1504265 RepID=A0ABT9ZFM1_9BACI|nr:sensor domain-containing diguanylate cyclase [Metabacillus malikii]MDQ0231062.1 diguanylate cyclase (GGDEF)-like protein [Metabacillus malikii]
MDDQTVVIKLKSRFFEYLSQHYQSSTFDIVDNLIDIIKQELCVSHAVFYFYDEQNDRLTPHKDVTINSLRSLPKEVQDQKFYQIQNEVILPIIQGDRIFGLVSVKDLDVANYTVSGQDEIVKACTSFYTTGMRNIKSTHKELKFEQLYRITEKFHSFMNRDDVLIELINTLRGMYASYTFYLFLSHDNEANNDLPIKNLGYDEQQGNEMAMKAYVTGDAQVSELNDSKLTILYTPLKGKQGVYGVLQVVASQDHELPENRSFITLLAHTAGNALENAQLYEQSKRLIKDLQLINETSHRLNKNLRLTDNMTYMTTRIVESFDANEAGFFYFDKNDEINIFPGSTKLFESDDVTTYVQYVKEKIGQDLEGIFIGDLSAHIQDAKFQSLMAVPMIQSGSLKGCALVLHESKYHFTFDMYKLLQSLIHHSALALTNSLLREELEMLVNLDHLTQLYSRKYMNECIEKSMKVDRQGTYLLMDIDDFKKINDTYGHQIGDKILVQVANIIKNNIREKDIGARWGGEELAIYLPQVELKIGKAIAERIVNRVRENTDPMVTISCGVSYWDATSHHISYNQLFSQADQALYQAKNNGKNHVVVEL